MTPMNVRHGRSRKEMRNKDSFFVTELMPLVKEIEQTSKALNAVCEESQEGMCFLLKGTLDRIAKDFNEKLADLDRDYVVSPRTKKK